MYSFFFISTSTCKIVFIPQNSVEIKIEETDENMQIQKQIQNKLVSDFRKAMNKMLDKWNQIDL